jgi:hypothetical protein
MKRGKRISKSGRLEIRVTSYGLRVTGYGLCGDFLWSRGGRNDMMRDYGTVAE